MLWFAVFSTVKLLFFPFVINVSHRDITWDYGNTLILILFWVLLLASSDDFCLKQCLLWCLPNEDFLCSSFFLYLLTGILLKGQVSPLVEKPGRHHHLWCLPNGDFLFLSFFLRILIGILLWRQIFPSVEKPGRSHINQMIKVNVISSGANWRVSRCEKTRT